MNSFRQQPHCKKCDKRLTYDEIGIHKKMLGKGATEFFCFECLAERLNTTVDELKRLISVYREQGCELIV